ncbi:MAG: flagellin lysine-N-methylase [Clostridia bacterium]|jgi:lysine-N-methylase|nr:flagellin lysine-N-methylase [Clostridia bacterium]
MDKKYSALKLNIFDKFKCKGGTCVQTCCSGWRIDINLKEYEKIAERNRFGKSLDSFFTDFEIAGQKEKIIELNKDGSCPFLDDNKLCALQLKCGEEFLPKTCRNFPRITLMCGDVFEKTLSTGCEEVVRLLLDEKDGLALEEEKSISRGKVFKYIKGLVFNINENAIKDRPALSCWFDIQFLGLSILMDRSYTIEQRMLLLGMAMIHIDEFEKKGKTIEIPTFINAFLENVCGGKLKEQLSGFAKNEDLKVKMVISQAAILFYNGAREADIFDYIEKKLEIEKVSISNVNKGTGENEKVYCSFSINPEYNKKTYNKCEEFYKNFIRDKEYFIENFMVANYLFLYIPFKNRKLSIFDNYRMFVAIFTTFKFCIATYMDNTKTTDDLIYLTVAVSRTLVHNNRLTERANEILNAADVKTLAQLAILL